MGFDIGRQLTREEELLISKVAGEMHMFSDEVQKKFEDMLSSAIRDRDVSEVEAVAKLISDISRCPDPQSVAPVVLSALNLIAIQTQNLVEQGKRPVIFGPGPKGYRFGEGQ